MDIAGIRMQHVPVVNLMVLIVGISQRQRSILIVIPSEGVPVRYRDSPEKKKNDKFEMGIRFVGSRFGWAQPSPVAQ